MYTKEMFLRLMLNYIDNIIEKVIKEQDFLETIILSDLENSRLIRELKESLLVIKAIFEYMIEALKDELPEDTSVFWDDSWEEIIHKLCHQPNTLHKAHYVKGSKLRQIYRDGKTSFTTQEKNVGFVVPIELKEKLEEVANKLFREEG
jgi:uncharacterized FlgJ-related protein